MAGASRHVLSLKEIVAINRMFCLIQKLMEVRFPILWAIKGYGPQSSHVIIVVGIPWLTVSAFLDHDTRFGAVLLRAFSIQHSGLPALMHFASQATVISSFSNGYNRWSDPMVYSAAPCSTANMCFHDFCLSSSSYPENMALKFLTLGMAPLRTFLPHSLAGSWHLRHSWYPSLREPSPSEPSGVSSSYSDVFLLKQNCFR